VDAGVDVLSSTRRMAIPASVPKMVQRVKSEWDVQVIAGNVATAEATQVLVDAGADAVKVGVGPGSICTTRIVAGVGVPQITAIYECARDASVPIVADGGMTVVRGHREGDRGRRRLRHGGLAPRRHRREPGRGRPAAGRALQGVSRHGSLGAMRARGSSRDRYFQGDVEDVEKLVPEGIEGRVPYKGPLAAILHQLVGGLRQAMGYCGAATIEE
jgi:IMP dehydrogenase